MIVQLLQPRLHQSATVAVVRRALVANGVVHQVVVPELQRITITVGRLLILTGIVTITKLIPTSTAKLVSLQQRNLLVRKHLKLLMVMDLTAKPAIKGQLTVELIPAGLLMVNK